jgi:hypothetical protein
MKTYEKRFDLESKKTEIVVSEKRITIILENGTEFDLYEETNGVLTILKSWSENSETEINIIPNVSNKISIK